MCSCTSLWCASSLHLVHRPTKTNQPPAFPKPGKITVVSFSRLFFPYLVSIVSVQTSAICLFLKFSLSICLFVFEAVCLSSCFLFLPVCPSLSVSLSVSQPGCLLFVNQLFLHFLASTSVDNRLHLTYRTLDEMQTAELGFVHITHAAIHFLLLTSPTFLPLRNFEKLGGKSAVSQRFSQPCCFLPWVLSVTAEPLFPRCTTTLYALR